MTDKLKSCPWERRAAEAGAIAAWTVHMRWKAIRADSGDHDDR